MAFEELRLGAAKAKAIFGNNRINKLFFSFKSPFLSK